MEPAKAANHLKFLITGASGFIGASLLEHLLENDFSGVAITHHRPIPIKNWSDQKKFTTVEGNLSPEFLAEKVSSIKPDVIFHLAGITSNDHPDLYAVNVDSTRNILKAVQDHAPNCAVILLSTAAVYGHSKTPSPLAETVGALPINEYGKSKLAAEKIALEFLGRGLKVYVVRAFNIVGVHQSKNFLVPAMCAKFVEIEKGNRPPQLDVINANYIRDFIDVRDLCSGLLNMIQSKAPYGIYNISSGVGVSIGEVAKTIAQQVKVKNIDFNMIQGETESKNTIAFSVGDPQKAAKTFNWKSSFPLSESIIPILDYFRSN